MTSVCIGDNYGPADVNETLANWEIFEAAFPNAKIHASTLDNFWALLHTEVFTMHIPAFADT